MLEGYVRSTNWSYFSSLDALTSVISYIVVYWGPAGVQYQYSGFALCLR